MCLGAVTGAKADSKFIAATEFEFNPSKKIKSNLGNKSQTRIDFSPHYIKEIIGDASSFIAAHDSKGKFVYLLPKLPVGEKINLSLITTSGKAQDFEFKVTEDEGKAIIVTSKEITGDNLVLEDHELKSLLNAMIANSQGKYYVQDFTVKTKKSKSKCSNCQVKKRSNPKYVKGILLEQNKLSKLFKELEIREQKIYTYDLLKLKGIVLEVKNLSRNKQIINEKYFAEMFSSAVLVSLQKQELLPKENSKVFIITKSSEGTDA